MILLRALWAILFVIWLVYSNFIYGNLPEKVATTFDFQGNPVSWMDKSSAAYLFLAIFFFMNSLFFLLMLFIKKMPVSIINIPWKSYWFKDETTTRLAFAKLQNILAQGGIFINLMFLFSLHITAQENAVSVNFTIPVNTSVTTILVVSVAWVISIFLYTKPPKNEEG